MPELLHDQTQQQDMPPHVRLTTLITHILERLCLVAIMAFLGITSVVSLLVTTSLPHYNYIIEYNFTSFPIVAIGSAVAVALLSTKRILSYIDKWDATKLTNVLAAYMAVLGCFWIVLANVWPEWDSQDVATIAQAIMNGTKMSADSYASRFQFQIPLALLIAFLRWLFADAYYQAFELLNVLSVVATLYAMRSLAVAIFGKGRFEKLSVILTTFFFPLVFYCTFMYANLIVLPLCIMALALQIKSMKEDSFKPAILSVFLVSIAIFLKSSMILQLAGMIVVWLVHAMKERRWAPCCFQWDYSRAMR